MCVHVLTIHFSFIHIYEWYSQKCHNRITLNELALYKSLWTTPIILLWMAICFVVAFSVFLVLLLLLHFSSSSPLGTLCKITRLADEWKILCSFIYLEFCVFCARNGVCVCEFLFVHGIDAAPFLNLEVYCFSLFIVSKLAEMWCKDWICCVYACIWLV